MLEGRVLRRTAAVLGAVLLAGGLSWAAFYALQRSYVARLEAAVSSFRMPNAPLRFRVLSRSDQNVSARFSFYDADGKEISSFERSWSGYELGFETFILPVGDRVLAFPVRVFTDAVPLGRGTDLIAYYDRNGFPGIYSSANLDPDLRGPLGSVFSRIKSALSDVSAADDDDVRWADLGPYGEARRDLRRLRVFEVGAAYTFAVDADGDVDILRE